MSLLEINGERKVGLDFLADLWSGRIHQTLAAMNQKQLEGQIQMTQTEQKILDAASVIAEAATAIKSGVDSLTAKIETLQEQAMSPVAYEPEDLTDELGALANSTAMLQSVADSFKPAPDVDVTVPAEATIPEPTGAANSTAVDPPAPGTEETPAFEETVPDPNPTVYEPEAPGVTVTDPFTEETPVVADTVPTEEVPAAPVEEEAQPVADETDEDESEDSVPASTEGVIADEPATLPEVTEDAPVEIMGDDVPVNTDNW